MNLKHCSYLEKIGLATDNYFGNYCYKDEVRSETWKKEQEEYGFDERETWNIDTCLAEWLYTRLKRYQEITIVNTDVCKHNIDGKEIALSASIQEIVDNCEFYLLNKWNEHEQEAYEKMKKALHILENIFPSLWW